jgi:hypothetical protein
VTVKLNMAFTEEQYDGIKTFADRHGTSVLQMIRDVACDLAGLDAAVIRPRKSSHTHDPVRMPPLPEQTPQEIAAGYARRGFGKSYIAARTKLKWREIEDIMKANPHADTKV